MIKAKQQGALLRDTVSLLGKAPSAPARPGKAPRKEAM